MADNETTNWTIGTIYICEHCGGDIGKVARKFCKFCETAEMRKNADKENEEITTKKESQGKN